MKVELKSLFSVPLIKFKFTKHHLYNFPEVAKSVKKPDAWVKPLNTSFGFSCGDDFFNDDMRLNMHSDLMEDLYNVFNTLGIPSEFEIKQLWYNIYHENQGQESHDHIPGIISKPPYWCGVYYNKGNIPTIFMKPYNYHKINSHEEYNSPQSVMFKYFCDFYEPEIEPGDVVLFPPWLQHYVDTKNECKDKMRLTFSFNIEYTGN
jgi:hypothetical protein